jgi:hypothetical protein
MDDIKASFQMQLKTVGGGSKESEDRAAKAEAEVLELRAQLKVAKEAAAAAEAVREDAAALKMTKIQLQKAELDKTSLLNKVLFSSFFFALTLIEDTCTVVRIPFHLVGQEVGNALDAKDLACAYETECVWGGDEMSRNSV